MNFPLQISFHGITPSKALTSEIEERVEKLGRFYNRIVGCRVVVELPNRHHRKGKPYQVRINMAVPGGEIVIGRLPGKDEGGENVHVALRNAFANALRMLRDFARKQRREIKQHNGKPHGKVVRLFPNEQCGFLATLDGRDVYFHERSVLNGDFETLTIGDEVRFIEEQGEKGPQATSVELVGREGKHEFTAA